MNCLHDNSYHGTISIEGQCSVARRWCGDCGVLLYVRHINLVTFKVDELFPDETYERYYTRKGRFGWFKELLSEKRLALPRHWA